MPIQPSVRDYSVLLPHFLTSVLTHKRGRSINNGRTKRTTALCLFVVQVGGIFPVCACQRTIHLPKRRAGTYASHEHEGVPRFRCRRESAEKSFLMKIVNEGMIF